MTRKEKVHIKESLPYDLTFHANGEITAKRGYYYRTVSLEQITATILQALPGARVVDSGDHFRPWPRDSYLWVRFVPLVTAPQKISAV